MSNREEKSEIRQIFHQKEPKLWASLKADQRDRLIKTFMEASNSVTYQQRTSVYSGPIPSPEMLDQYNSAMPNGADRIMRMAEAQSEHRMRLEHATISSQNKQSERGQLFALVSVILLIVAGVFAIFLNQPVVATVIFGTTILGMGAVYAYGKYQIRRNLDKKS